MFKNWYHFSRFSNFVKSGGEAYIIGSSNTDVKIPREERVAIQVCLCLLLRYFLCQLSCLPCNNLKRKTWSLFNIDLSNYSIILIFLTPFVCRPLNDLSHHWPSFPHQTLKVYHPPKGRFWEPRFNFKNCTKFIQINWTDSFNFCRRKAIELCGAETQSHLLV